MVEEEKITLHNGNQLIWPPRTQLTVSMRRGKVVLESRNCRYSLSDQVMLCSGQNYLTAHLSVSTKADGWTVWNDEALEYVERRIKYDLEFDGYRVSVQRITPVPRRRAPCTTPFQWKLRIRPGWA